MLTRIDHIGVAVEDLDAAIALYSEQFEMKLVHREVVESQGIEAVLLDVGEGHIELMQPLGPDTNVGRFITKRGVGMHHVAYSVPDIAAAVEEAKAAGFELIDAEPRIGMRGSKIVFLHPRSTGGVLTELVQPVEGH